MKKIMTPLILMLAMAACATSETNDHHKVLVETEAMAFYIDTLAEGLQNPWGMEFLPDGRILIAERPGRLRIWKDGSLLHEQIEGLPDIWSHGQGGLLDVVMHPKYTENNLLYLVYAARGNGGGNTAISKGKLAGNQLTDLETIFHAQPHTEAAHHFGSRIVFDDDGYLFSTIGDRAVMNTAQDLSSHNGTIIRLHDDGTIPPDNPFVADNSALPEIWSYGHRNIQGMQLHPVSRELWAIEHGPRGGDEINRIHKGGNYGWPLVTHGINYDGTTITPDTTAPGMIDPILHWTPSIAPCGYMYVDSDYYPQWRYNMLVTALAGQHIHRVVFEDTTVVHTEIILQDFARFRAIEQGPDGLIYVLTEGPGLFFRLVPK